MGITAIKVAVVLAGTLAAGTATAIHGGPDQPITMISAPQLKAQLDAGRRPLLIDLRTAEEYQNGHLPRARSIPLAQLRRRYQEIPRGRIVLYCSCPREELDAVYRLLATAGVEMVEGLEEGFGGWVARGYPIER
ncbi:MAG TPA: rhodanese-like domain-containing protein [Methylomirabilota bacterium]|jgi:rhodanese-related sulfurtransferase|nr:rhodanese-like domain-containing protein [Methylomirabilota bacterium]